MVEKCKRRHHPEQLTTNCPERPPAERVPEEDAMRTDSKALVPREEAAEVGPDTIEQVMRERVRATIETI